MQLSKSRYKETGKKRRKFAKSNQENAGVPRITVWPAHSPDLIITECVGDSMYPEKQKIQPTSKTELMRCADISLQNSWKN